MVRRIVEIDQKKCNGCGLCASACHEGAIGMVDGKATLLKDGVAQTKLSFIHQLTIWMMKVSV